MQIPSHSIIPPSMAHATFSIQTKSSRFRVVKYIWNENSNLIKNSSSYSKSSPARARGTMEVLIYYCQAHNYKLKFEWLTSFARTERSLGRMWANARTWARKKIVHKFPPDGMKLKNICQTMWHCSRIKLLFRTSSILILKIYSARQPELHWPHTTVTKNLFAMDN